MEIDLETFDSAIAWLEFVVDHPAFRDDDWATALPLLPSEFVERVDLWNQQSPGVENEFKLAFQFVLNTWDDQRLERFWGRRMDFGLPAPPCSS